MVESEAPEERRGVLRARTRVLTLNEGLKSDVAMLALLTRSSHENVRLQIRLRRGLLPLSFGARPTGRRGESTLPSARRHVLGRGSGGGG